MGCIWPHDTRSQECILLIRELNLTRSDTHRTMPGLRTTASASYTLPKICSSQCTGLAIVDPILPSLTCSGRRRLRSKTAQYCAPQSSADDDPNPSSTKLTQVVAPAVATVPQMSCCRGEFCESKPGLLRVCTQASWSDAISLRNV